MRTGLVAVIGCQQPNSFIMQYLSPKVIRDFGFMVVLDDDENPDMVVTAIQDDEGYRQVREKLSDSCNVNNRIPNIQIENADIHGDRLLSLVHHSQNRNMLHERGANAVLQHIAYLWGYAVEMVTVDPQDKVMDSYLVEYK
jgi:stage V sporulation protein R